MMESQFFFIGSQLHYPAFPVRDCKPYPSMFWVPATGGMTIDRYIEIMIDLDMYGMTAIFESTK